MNEFNFCFVDKKLSQDQKELLRPKRGSNLASGFDLVANIDSSVKIKSGERVLVPTGISLMIPPGYEAQVRSRSGLALKHGVCVLNSPGTIDADYRGEIKVIIINFGQDNFEVLPHMRIAQLVFAPVILAELEHVDILEKTQRQDGGFGSTGLM